MLGQSINIKLAKIDRGETFFDILSRYQPARPLAQGDQPNQSKKIKGGPSFPATS